jgi:hypothetical protein
MQIRSRKPADTERRTAVTQHILMTRATRRPYREAPVLPDNVEYDVARGYWITNGAPLVRSRAFAEQARVTKKCDQETGEDQKSE